MLADRGEFEGYQADHLAGALNVRVSNTPPYRADWKGIIERHFRVANDRVIHFTPGAVRPRLRGAEDYRLDAALTLDEFRQLLVCYALDHNQNNYLAWYRKDEWQIADNVERYPLELWNSRFAQSRGPSPHGAARSGAASPPAQEERDGHLQRHSPGARSLLHLRPGAARRLVCAGA
ncbi:MAG: hypothetical protein ACREEM_23480 [Blastocatellia bacterium]